ncbi:uncharacterized protein BCR38DRAFT_495220 [Pseudomassariella vexata]|uniref:Integral membrane protein n=1 Tax=Pseudomassariella vexata TaxID=1141098 RepID=A0A1Y2DQL8_9PEZI|nr:uncharacterized protein BCR38DRAFT_495220 [Pseudomassariella vexata]ORY61593.1 hypothetical protein BCR38DRAFT_495220 [Pseudomassariella vexata]
MAHNGSRFKPPLPPWSPTPPRDTSISPAENSSQLSYFPSPPSGPHAHQGMPPASYPAPRSPDIIPIVSDVVPLVPTRQHGLHGDHRKSPGSGVPAVSSSSGLAPPNLSGISYVSFPPPPPSPNQSGSGTPDSQRFPLPPRPNAYLGLSGVKSPQGNYPTPPPLSPGAQSPYKLTSFPPPPPSPPGPPAPGSRVPSRTSAYNSHPGPPSRPTACPIPAGLSYKPRASYTPDPKTDPEIPSSPPPAYKPLRESLNSHSPSPAAFVSTLSEKGQASSPLATASRHTSPLPSPPPAASPPAGSGSVAETHQGASRWASILSSPSSIVCSIPSNGQVSNPASQNELSFFPPPPPEAEIDEMFQAMHLKSETKRVEFSSLAVEQWSDGASYLTGMDIAPSRVSAPASTPHRPPKLPVPEGLVSFPPATPGTPPSAVTSCIDTVVTFATTWYWHSAAPGFLICSRCYADYIWCSPFRSEFSSSCPIDGKPRVCRFSRPQMRDHLFISSIESMSLEQALGWMRRRATIPDCKGEAGVEGDANVRLYKPRYPDDIPGFVVCRACYEDRILTNELNAFFEPSPSQPSASLWACAMAVPYIQKEYEEKGKTYINAWPQFAIEARGRLIIPPCPGRGKALTHGKRWFVPKEGPQGIVFCHACYCDQVVHTGQESNWREAVELTKLFSNHVRCAMGQFNIKITMARRTDTKDYSVFWAVVNKVVKEKMCDDTGILNGEWYTFPSNPAEFGICKACYIAIAGSLNVAGFFVPKLGIPPNTTLLCCFNLLHPRLKSYMPKLLEMYFTRDPTSFEKYASTYAAIPPCPHDTAAKSVRWYGWRECTICP